MGQAIAIVAAVAQTLGDLRSDIYQAKVLANNAKIAGRNAGLASDAAQIEQQRSDNEYAELQGRQLAQQGASGLDIFGRTQNLTREASSRVGREQAMDIREEGTQESRRFLQEKANFKGAAREQYIKAGINFIGNAAATAGAAGAGGGGPESTSLVSKSRPSRRRFSSDY